MDPSGGGVGNCKSAEGFIDRSKVRILLCDNDVRSSQEVFTLLCKCSYQVTSVKSPRQVIDALNAEGPDIDIILSEVDLPMAKGLKLLKYIMRDKELRRIPVIMMSAQDKVSLVVKCLRLGAADYLVKPLRSNELLNLWTHMWRRRRMLGLAEKNILNYDFDLVVSDPSDANTNSTTLFSDDTDEKSRRHINQDICMSTCQNDEVKASTVSGTEEIQYLGLSKNHANVQGISNQPRGQVPSAPKKSELKIGQSSAFFTYVKTNASRSSTQEIINHVDEAAAHPPRIRKKLNSCDRQVDNQGLAAPLDENIHRSRIGNKHNPWNVQVLTDYVESHEHHPQGEEFRSCNGTPESFSVDRSCTPPFRPELTQLRNSKMEELPEHMHQRSNSHHEVSGFHTYAPHPYYVPGVMNQVMMPSPASMYQKNVQDMQHHHASALVPQYNHIPHCPPHMSGMTPFPYYPVGVCLQPGQMPVLPPWVTHASPSVNNGNSCSKVDRREAALQKFRQKRKERCFDKKIRYVNRKKLAERRPRVRGQFVRKINGINVDLNGQPTSTDFDEDDEEEGEEEDQATRESDPDDDS